MGIRLNSCVVAAMMIILSATRGASGQAPQASITVRTTDEQGAAIAGARARLTDAAGLERSGIADSGGSVAFPDLSSGTYSLQVSAEQFLAYEEKVIEVSGGQSRSLIVTLRPAPIEQTISVFANSVLEVQYIGGSLVIQGDAIARLAGTAGGLEALLRALAPGVAGPFGPPTLVNGFENAELPSIDSIREIRVKSNAFAAEYGALGLGRIEILTKPGNEKLRVAAFTNRSDAAINSRNPFAIQKAPYESDMLGGNISGSLIPRKATFFIDFSRTDTHTNSVINATTLDSFSRITTLRQSFVTPQRRTSFSPSMDWQVGKAHTLTFRYNDSRTRDNNLGIGEFALFSRGQESSGRAQTFQMTETSVFGGLVHELRAQVVRNRSSRYGDNSAPSIDVPGAFLGGGADIGVSYHWQTLTEAQDFIAFQTRHHAIKAGIQWRQTRQEDGSTENFGGTYRFAARIAPQLDANNEAIIGSDDLPVMIPITTIEAYRRTVVLRAKGLSPEETRQLGGGASQFSLRAGAIETEVTQHHVAGYLQDDWRIHPSFMVSSGLRYETQSDARSSVVAPRIAFAWTLDRSSRSRTIARGGIGVFYERIPERVALRARQLDGTGSQQYLVTNNDDILDLYPVVPSPALLTGFSITPATLTLGNVEAPRVVHASVSIERQVLPNLTMAATLSEARGSRQLRSRNVNAPFPGTYDPAVTDSGIRPNPQRGDIFEYETTGVSRQRQFLLNAVYRAGKRATLWSTYTFNDAKSDVDFPEAFPSDNYDLPADYGRSSSQARHTVYVGGWVRIPGGIDLTPLTLWRSGTPFDITTGQDLNGDSVYNDRPAFATDLGRPSVVITRFGAFDLAPTAGQQIIPRNYGLSPAFLIANLRIGKTVRVSKLTSLTLSVQGTNIFNHTNMGSPVGNLGSRLFGESTISAGDWGLGANQAGNRRFEAMIHLAFQ